MCAQQPRPGVTRNPRPATAQGSPHSSPPLAPPRGPHDFVSKGTPRKQEEGATSGTAAGRSFQDRAGRGEARHHQLRWLRVFCQSSLPSMLTASYHTRRPPPPFSRCLSRLHPQPPPSPPVLLHLTHMHRPLSPSHPLVPAPHSPPLSPPISLDTKLPLFARTCSLPRLALQPHLPPVPPLAPSSL